MWRNRERVLAIGRDYTWFITLNIEITLSPADVAALWGKIGRKLRKQGFVGLWVREVSPTDHVNYHVISSSAGDADAQIRKAIPAGIPYHLQVQRFDPQRAWLGLRYVVKARTQRHFNGRLVSSDRWASKRTFFQPGVKLSKWDTIGPFWEGTTKAKLWQEIKDREKRIADGMTVDGAEELVEYLDELTDGLWGKARIRRAVGFFAREYEAEGTLHPPKPFEYEPPQPSGSPQKAVRKPRKVTGDCRAVAAPVGSVGLLGGTRDGFGPVMPSYPEYHPP